MTLSLITVEKEDILPLPVEDVFLLHITQRNIVLGYECYTIAHKYMPVSLAIFAYTNSIIEDNYI